jgi:hypothetical protein
MKTGPLTGKNEKSWPTYVALSETTRTSGPDRIASTSPAVTLCSGYAGGNLLWGLGSVFVDPREVLDLLDCVKGELESLNVT